jgi:hypothetical protein
MRPPAADAGRAGSGLPVAAGRRVRVPQLAVGLLLAGGAALAFVLIHAAGVARTPVVALATDVARGQVVTAADLQLVHIATDDAVAVTAPDRLEGLVGRPVVADLAAGTLLTAELLSTSSPLLAGGGVVGLALQPGEYPSPQLMVGDQVTVIEVSDVAQQLVDAAEVIAIEPLATQGQRFVSLLTDEPAAADIAAAAATGQVRLVLIAPDTDTGSAGSDPAPDAGSDAAAGGGQEVGR